MEEDVLLKLMLKKQLSIYIRFTIEGYNTNGEIMRLYGFKIWETFFISLL